jgi:hypothetical protein
VAEQLAARLIGDEAELFLGFHRQLVRTSAESWVRFKRRVGGVAPPEF